MKDKIEIIEMATEKIKKWDWDHPSQENKSPMSFSNTPWMKIIIASIAIAIGFIIIKKVHSKYVPACVTVCS